MDKIQAVVEPRHVWLQGQPQAHIEDFPAAMQGVGELDRAPDDMVDLSIGNPHRTRADLAEAESSLLVHLELYEWLGNKEGVAAAYGNLGDLYQTLGDLVPAEAMYKKALERHEALGRKEGMAAACGNLALVYQARGDMRQAAAMYKKSMGLVQQATVNPHVQ